MARRAAVTVPSGARAELSSSPPNGNTGASPGLSPQLSPGSDPPPALGRETTTVRRGLEGQRVSVDLGARTPSGATATDHDARRRHHDPATSAPRVFCPVPAGEIGHPIVGLLVEVWSRTGNRMGSDNDSVPTPSVGPFVVILGGQRGHGGREFSRERGSVGGRRESDLAVDRQRGERLAGSVSKSGQTGDFANHSSGHGNEVTRSRVGRSQLDRRRSRRGLTATARRPVRLRASLVP